jgi:hypothetical protein
MINKKGQGMSISTIILLILGLIVLVVLILGFVMGWKPLLALVSPGNNLKTIQQSCAMACTSNSQYDFCSVKRQVNDGKNDKFEATCNDLATKQIYISREYGIEACPSITCAN